MSASSFRNDGERYYDKGYNNKQNKSFECIINNNNNNTNIISGGNQTISPELTENNVYVVWEDNIFGNYEIFFAVSRDGGQTFSTPKNLSNNLGASVDPQITSEGNNVYVVWQDVAFGNNDIFIAVSDDNGLNFSTPENLSNNATLSSSPQISSEGNNVYVVWVDIGTVDIFFAVSTNNGQTFSTPENISDNVEVSTSPQISTEGNNVNVVWKDYILGNAYSDIFFAVSNNNGQTFSMPENISISEVGDSFLPQISSEGNNVYVIWADDFADIFFAVSNNNGQTFSMPENISNNTGISENPQISSSSS